MSKVANLICAAAFVMLAAIVGVHMQKGGRIEGKAGGDARIENSTNPEHPNLETTNATTIASLDRRIADLRFALKAKDSRSSTRTTEALADFIRGNPEQAEELIDTMTMEDDSMMFLALGKIVLKSGTEQHRDLLRDTALNVVLSEDTSARRTASLQILSEFHSFTVPMWRAITRVSHEDSSPEVKVAAAALAEKWTQLHPEFRVESNADFPPTADKL